MALKINGFRVWIVISLTSLLVWVTYWLRADWVNFIRYLQDPNYAYVVRLGFVFWAAHVGITCSFIAVLLGILACSLMFGFSKPFRKVKNLVITALILESVYFLSLLPSVPYLMNRFEANALAISYLVQVFFAVPFLLTLVFGITRNYNSTIPSKKSLLKYGSLALLGFTVALWANAAFRWADMVYAGGLDFLTSGIRSVGFFDAAIFMTLAVAFASLGSYFAIKQRAPSTIKWLGLALTMIGLYYTVYLVYAAYVMP
jgi:hypothetical protein